MILTGAPPRHGLACALLLLAGCGYSTTTCVDVSRVAVADDAADELGFSVDDLLAWVAGSHDASGVYEDGTPADVAVTVTRRAGAAEVVTTELESEQHGLPIFQSDTMMNVSCAQPTLMFPVELAVWTSDGGIDTRVDALARATTADDVYVDADLAPTKVTGLPLPEDPSEFHSCDATDPDKAFYSARLTTGVDSGGQLGWEGSESCPDGTDIAWARYMLQWGSMAP